VVAEFPPKPPGSEPRRPAFLSGRESETLAWLARHRFLFQPHLAELLFGGSPHTPRSKRVLTQRVLDGLRQRSLVAATQRLVGGPGGGSGRVGYFLTPRGARLAATLVPGLPLRRDSAIRGTFLVGHAAMTADVALAFRRAARTRAGHELVDWECDWQAALRLGSSTVIPDARLVYRTAGYELTAFIEIDLGTEGTRFFARKVERYLDLYVSGDWRSYLSVWPLVLTVTPQQSRASALRLATESVLEAHGYSEADPIQFDFAAVGDVTGSNGPLGSVWQVAGRSGVHPLTPDGDDPASEEPLPDSAARQAEGSK